VNSSTLQTEPAPKLNPVELDLMYTHLYFAKWQHKKQKSKKITKKPHCKNLTNEVCYIQFTV